MNDRRGAARATAHVDAVVEALFTARDSMTVVESWGARLATRLSRGRRLLVAGNGGSAAEASHLAAELVGRYRHDRRPLSAIALSADHASLTAIANDYGAEEVFARQVIAHGGAGDVFLGLSTSGCSLNVLRAARAARAAGLATWAMTGALPNPLADVSDEWIAVRGETATVQEVHLVAIHALCAALDAAMPGVTGDGSDTVDGAPQRAFSGVEPGSAGAGDPG